MEEYERRSLESSIHDSEVWVEEHRAQLIGQRCMLRHWQAMLRGEVECLGSRPHLVSSYKEHIEECEYEIENELRWLGESQVRLEELRGKR